MKEYNTRRNHLLNFQLRSYPKTVTVSQNIIKYRACQVYPMCSCYVLWSHQLNRPSKTFIYQARVRHSETETTPSTAKSSFFRLYTVFYSKVSVSNVI